MDGAPRTNGWTPERRARQAQKIREWKPWQKSTGPRTPEGKRKVSQNAYKHGFRGPAYKEICRLLRWQRDFVKAVEAIL